MIAVFCIGIALWFLKDGLISWPQQREWALEFESAEEQGVSPTDWKEIAREHGWDPDSLPGEPKSEGDIRGQFVYATIALVPGLLYLLFLALHWGRWIEMTDTGLRTSRGRTFDFSDIQTLNKKKWKDKGIAKIAFQTKSGTKRLTLDDWKYESEPIAAILREVESHIDEEQIVDGFPVPPPGEVEEEDRQEEESQDDSAQEGEN